MMPKTDSGNYDAKKQPVKNYDFRQCGIGAQGSKNNSRPVFDIMAGQNKKICKSKVKGVHLERRLFILFLYFALAVNVCEKR